MSENTEIDELVLYPAFNLILKILTLSVNKNIDNVFCSGYIINGNILLK